MKTIKRKKSVRRIDRTSVQKSLSIFLEEAKEEEEYKDKIETKEIEKEITEDKIIEKRLPNQIETDYYEQSLIDTCTKRLRERFGIVNIEIMPVRYGSIQKIYGYYMLITVRDRDKDIITKFIKEECSLKVY